jgi:hypothetical protein
MEYKAKVKEGRGIQYSTFGALSISYGGCLPDARVRLLTRRV